jgi:hypothetical protein
MKYYIQCPHDECKRVFFVPWELSNQLTQCPHCSCAVFCDRLAQTKLADDAPAPESVPLPVPEGPIAKIELQCLGPAGNGHILGQCMIDWFEVSVNQEDRSVAVSTRRLPIRSYKPENGVNIVWYHVPENVICRYDRHAQANPCVYEQRYFWVKDGAYIDLGEADRTLIDFPKRFLSEYTRYRVTVSS